MQLVAAPRQLPQLVAQIMVIVGRTVDGFRDAPAVGIVAVGDIRPGLAHPRELAAVLPCVRPRLPRRLIVLAHITRDSHAGIISFLIPCGPIVVMLLETG